ncbi:hypothetical protein KAR91_28070 [Candidatus Pacearchaeota archaeon]|nr:hypothetical protein [Candidatus Pacearchaeota archaeon]
MSKDRKIFGLGARYGNDWMNLMFIKAGEACIGFNKGEAVEIHEQMKTIGKGDIIFLKAFGPNSKHLCVMGVGIVTGTYRKRQNGFGCKVDWVFTPEEESCNCCDGQQCNIAYSTACDKHRNVRTGTLFQEFSPAIKERVINLMSIGLQQ